MMDAYTHLDMSTSDPLADLERRMDSAGVNRALVVETWGKDNRACLDLVLGSGSSRFRVGLCFRPDEGELKPEVLQSDMLAALRVRTADIQAVAAFAPTLAESGKWLLPHSESGIGPLARELVRLTQQHPKLRIFLPHLGWPRHDGKDDIDWRESISRLSLLPNIVVGISAVAHFSREPFPHKDVEPFVAHLRKVFGPELLLAGSDYPLFEKGRYADYMNLAESWIGWQGRRPRALVSALFGQLTFPGQSKAHLWTGETPGHNGD